MTEHLPECRQRKYLDDVMWGRVSRDEPYVPCICDELRACEERMFALHPEWTVTGMCKPDCAACRRLTELITEWEDGYEKGLDAAREAVASMEVAVVGNSAATVDQALAVIESLWRGSND